MESYLADSLIRDWVSYVATIASQWHWVQGAGGNASWKTDDTLWVKASGKWLAFCEQEPMFVPVNLPSLRYQLSTRHIQPFIGDGPLRPSIETLFHALLPQRLVLHLHDLTCLSILIRADAPQILTDILGHHGSWIWVPYIKPGAPLAMAIQDRFTPNTSVVFLQNHGVIIGGNTVSEVQSTLTEINSKLGVAIQSMGGIPPLQTPPYLTHPSFDKSTDDPQWLTDPTIQQIAHHHRDKPDTPWAICPDHVVFLGASAPRYNREDSYIDSQTAWGLLPSGIMASRHLSMAQLQQLWAYGVVLNAHPPQTPPTVLSDAECADLLNWESEHYRQGLSL